jgi:2-phosphosulfolactate phosphatase
MRFQHATLENCEHLSGTVVVIDVLRAFTTAAYAFSAGAENIFLVSTINEAFRLKQDYPEALLMGEERGLPINGFDFGNSPISFVTEDLTGRTIIQRTSAGTQGVVGSKNAQVLLASSLCCATATAQYIRSVSSKVVTFVISGNHSDDHGEEDRACADLIESLLKDQVSDQQVFVKRVRASAAARKFLDPADQDYPYLDLEYATAIDQFNFSMLVERQNDLFVMKAVPQS